MIEALWNQHDTPKHVRDHCAKVAEVALTLAAQIDAPIKSTQLEQACLLLDIVRPLGKTHPIKGAAILSEAGYPEIGDIISQHHTLEKDASIEAKLLYLADKLVKGTAIVTLGERFEASRIKCVTPEAQAAWQRRYDAAASILTEYGLGGIAP